MKKFNLTGLFLLCMFFAANSFSQSGSTEQLTVPLSSPGKSYTLKVELISGSIKVVSYDGKDIIIDVTVSKSEDESEASKETENGMKRISQSGGYEVTAKENDNTIQVYTSNPNKEFKLSLKIPQDVKLKLSTINEGDIKVENVRGELEISNVNGAIELIGISGSVVANTVNEDITVTFVSVDPKAPMAFSTLNGNVNVSLPADTKANLKLKSDMGDIYSDFNIEIDKSQSKVNKTTEPGMYKIKKDDWIYGKINGGGPEMLMKNMQGDIYVKKSAK